MLELSNTLVDSELATEILRQEQRIFERLHLNPEDQTTVYVLSLHARREAEAYISPHIINGELLARELSRQFGVDVVVDGVVDIPQNRWIGLKSTFWSDSPITAATIAVIVWMHVNNRITVT